jgi:thiamine-phosphate pyrophosphorylase
VIGDPVICLVTPGNRHPEETLARVRAAIAAGVTLVQIREPQLPDRVLFDLTRAAGCAAPPASARIVVNDRLDVALAAGAHGVHLRGSSFDAARVRARGGSRWLIGRSVHDADEARAVERGGGCDYLVFGTVFASPSKPGAHTAGLEALREVCRCVNLPVVAIGGITCGNVAAVRAAGAAGMAAISLFADVKSISSVVESVRRTFDT